MSRTITTLIILVIQLLGILVWGWDFRAVFLIYVLQMIIIGISSSIAFLIPIRQKNNSLSSILTNVLIGIGWTALLIPTYFMMTFLGSLIFLGVVVDFNPDTQINWQLFFNSTTYPVLFFLILNEIPLAARMFKEVFLNHLSSNIIMRPYLEEGIFLTTLILFFGISALLFLATHQRDVNFQKTLALAFVIVRAISDNWITNWLNKKYEQPVEAAGLVRTKKKR